MLSVLYHLSNGHWVTASLHNSQYHSVCAVRTWLGIDWYLLSIIGGATLSDVHVVYTYMYIVIVFTYTMYMSMNKHVYSS